MSTTIEYHKEAQGFARLVLNRPDKHNAFNAEMIDEIRKQLDELENDTSLKFLMLEANGKSFSAGADLNWMKSMVNYSKEENKQDSLTMSDMYKRLYNLKIPLIGVAKGFTLGGGVGLLAVCDYVLADEQAVFGLTEVRLGLIPAVISPYVIAKIGYSASGALFTSGKRIDAKQALQIGLLHELADAQQLDEVKGNLINTYLEAGPEAIQHAKACVRKAVSVHADKDSEEALAEWIAERRISTEGQEGMNACLQKRKASWASQK